MTVRTLKVAPVTRSFSVRAGREQAFEIFTARMVEWVPSEHSLLDGKRNAIVMEPKVGGRWFETGADGAQCDWGFVRVWEPPSRLVAVWQLSSSWIFDPAIETEVEVRFTSEGDKRTRIDFEHRGFETYGVDAAMMREKLEAPTAWDHWFEGLRGLIG